MIPSKIIPITIVAFCGGVLQFQANAANAQMANFWPGQTLTAGEALRSGNWHTLVMQFDGNVVLYNGSNVPIWSTNTGGYAYPTVLIMQSDGNMVLYGSTGPLWASNTSGNPGAFLAVQDDGNLVIYQYGAPGATASYALWASGTTGQ
jgi:hypothetical protein